MDKIKCWYRDTSYNMGFKIPLLSIQIHSPRAVALRFMNFGKRIRYMPFLLEQSELCKKEIKMDRLTQKAYEDWCFGRTPYLERVCSGNFLNCQ